MAFIELTKDGQKEFVNTEYIMRVKHFATGMNKSGVQLVDLFVPYDESCEEIMEKIKESKE